MAIAYLLLGSNLGDRKNYIDQAVEKIKNLGQINQMSSYYESEAWGGQTEQAFINVALEIHTELSPYELLEDLLSIELELGRVRDLNKKYGERSIDIDIQFYDDLIIQTNKLDIPHPRMQDRKFALAPLSELNPKHVHPILMKELKDLLKECNDKLMVNVCKNL